MSRPCKLATPGDISPMRFRNIVLLLCLLAPILRTTTAYASETPAEHAANVSAAQEMAAAPVHGNLPDYSLPADKLATAQHLEQVRNNLDVTAIFSGILQLALLLWLGVIAWMRDTAVRSSRNHWGQGYIFLGLFLLADFLLNLPLNLYGHNLYLIYGLSIQQWGSWFVDKAKSLALTWIFGGLVMMLLFRIIGKFPRRWWLVFWAAAIPIVFFIVFVSPYVEPFFDHYEPLQKTNPALVEQLEKVVTKGNMNIPPERMFLMKASAKVTTLNADVEGFGASKRVVVWDNTITKATPDEILLIFGHESGHYVLNHVRIGVSLGIASIFIVLFLGYQVVQWSLARFGSRWRIPNQNDWGTLAVLLLVTAICSAVAQPIANTFSRHLEHDADVYGQEAVHGIVANPQQAARGAFQVLGETSLDVPNVSPLAELWLYNHPAIGRRAAFAAHYDPWAPDAAPKYFPKQ